MEDFKDRSRCEAKKVQRSSESAAVLRDNLLHNYAIRGTKVQSNSMSTSMLRALAAICAIATGGQLRDYFMTVLPAEQTDCVPI